jgi:hypothetical protein
MTLEIIQLYDGLFLSDDGSSPRPRHAAAKDAGKADFDNPYLTQD